MERDGEKSGRGYYRRVNEIYFLAFLIYDIKIGKRYCYNERRWWKIS